jgi:Ca-activated chloride channel family protein
MNDMQFLDMPMFSLLWLLLPLLLLFFHAAARRRRALAAFAEPGLAAGRVRPERWAGRAARFVLFCLAMIAMIAALARPVGNLQETEVKQTGRDLVFMLDVSQSMLANDLMPNRLERAKLAIRDCVEKLRGDRVALVAFAGEAAVKCPLTTDYGFFLLMLDAVDTTSIARGGTLLGDALRTTLKQAFDNREKQCRDIILLTDGEDHESFPVQAARQAAAAGVRLLAVGLGDAQEGRRIPVTTAAGQNGFLQYQGREVWSRLDGATLRRMAEATPGGRYLPVGTGTVDLGQIYLDLIASADRGELPATTVKRHEEKFQFFVATALVLLMAEGVSGRLLLAGFLILLPLLQPDLGAAADRARIKAGNAAYDSGDFAAAQQYYTEALAADANDPAAAFNRGDSLYRQEKYREAEEAFGQAIALGGQNDFLARSWFNRGNARFRTAGSTPALPEKLAELRESARCYEKSLQLDKNLPGAGRNLEICRRHIKETEKQLAGQEKNRGPQQDAPPQTEQQQKPQPEEAASQAQQREQRQPDEAAARREQQAQQSEGQAPGGDARQGRQQPQQDTSPDATAPQDRSPAGTPEGAAEPGKNNGEITAQTVEAILAAEKETSQRRRQRRLQTAPAAAEKDW